MKKLLIILALLLPLLAGAQSLTITHLSETHSMVVTVISLILPIFGESYGLMLAAFSLLGFASDAMGQAGAVAVMTIGVAYLFYYFSKIRN